MSMTRSPRASRSTGPGLRAGCPQRVELAVPPAPTKSLPPAGFWTEAACWPLLPAPPKLELTTALLTHRSPMELWKPINGHLPEAGQAPSPTSGLTKSEGQGGGSILVSSEHCAACKQPGAQPAVNSALKIN